MGDFVYKQRSAESLEKWSNQSSNDFESFIEDSFRLYKPKIGTNVIRILPPTDDTLDHWGTSIFVHYGVGPKRASVLCTQNMNKGRCPLCEAQIAAKNEGDEVAFKELRANKRVLAWVLNRDDEEAGPLLWAMPVQVNTNICKLSKNKRTGEIYAIDHPQVGVDVYFDVNGDGIQRRYEGYVLDREPSPVKRKWVEFVVAHPLPTTLTWRKYDLVRKLYEGTAPDDEEDVPPPTKGLYSRTSGRPTDEEPEEAATPKETVQRRPRPSQKPVEEVSEEPPVSSRREEINDEIPFDRFASEEPEPEEEPAPVKSVAQKLRERRSQ